MIPMVSSTTSVSNWFPQLVPGPEWRSFEQLRTSGPTALDGINLGQVATLRTKVHTFRIVRDEDFQKLIGLASCVHRIKQGVTVVLKAARVTAKHRDQESVDLLIQSALMLNESNVLPERDGHDTLHITPEEADEYGNDDFDVATAQIPRPKL